MEVTPLTHDWPPGGTLAGKITVMGIDGCSINQESATVHVAHPWN
jgi:hypothetical protein